MPGWCRASSACCMKEWVWIGRAATTSRTRRARPISPPVTHARGSRIFSPASPCAHSQARETGRRDRMELFIFARFQARIGAAEDLATALREVVGPTSREAGCLAIGAFGSTTEPGLFYIHSRGVDEAVFAAHGGMPHTVVFLRRVEPLLDHPLD